MSDRYMRRLPPPISTPLYTMSYACARAVFRFSAVTPPATSSELGAVKGWCNASSRPSSSFHSNMGNSVTHSRLCAASSTSPSERAVYWRTRSRVLFTSAVSPAPNSSRSPGCAALASSTAATASALRPSLMGFAASISPSSSTRRKATPGDPALTASAAMSPLGLIRELEIRLPSGMRQHLTLPPSATAPENTLKPQPATASETS
mmetsp:Transcript_10866/g.27479  ORF Transcript_10866/g.27479 Transcript_10866/m.27479 type:complete len:206 (+) Transcript_10866:222-839(+)